MFYKRGGDILFKVSDPQESGNAHKYTLKLENNGSFQTNLSFFTM